MAARNAEVAYFSVKPNKIRRILFVNKLKPRTAKVVRGFFVGEGLKSNKIVRFYL